MATAENGTAEKAKRTRTMGTIIVEMRDDGGPPGTLARWKGAAHSFATVDEAEKWIRESGVDNTTYRIIREVATFTVKHETTTTRRLT